MTDTFEAPQIDEAPAAAPEVDPADDLRAALSSAFDEAAAATHEEAEAPTRDERGRFVGRESAASEVADHEATSGEQQQEAAPDGQQAQAAPEAPAALPPELDRLQQTLKRHEPLYAARGIPAEQALDALFNAQRVLEERPYEAIQVLARQYGVDLSRLVQPPQQAQQQQAPVSTDPTVQAALDRLARLESHLTAQQQQTQQAQAAEVQRVINEFASDPKHEHFSVVEPLMAGFIEKGQAKGLEAAYEMACRAHPEVWRKMQAAEAEARAKTEREARAKAATEAKAKAVSVRGSPAVNGFAKPPESVRGVLEAAWDGRLN